MASNDEDLRLSKGLRATSEDGVTVGGAIVPFKVIQSIYNEITGKTETVNKYYNDPLKFRFDDLSSIHHRIIQTYGQYNILTQNYSITIYYLDNHKDTWSSFEKFQLFAMGSTSVTESVLFTYNFLIVLPGVQKPQSYTITLRFSSLVCIEARMQQDHMSNLPRFLSMVSNRPLRIEITYIDYNVARAFLAAIDEWIAGVPSSKNLKFVQFAQQRSHVVRKIIQFFIAIFTLFEILRIIPHFLNEKSNLLDLGRFTVIDIIFVYSVYFVSGFIGRFVENSIDRLSSPLSYIEISKGDTIQIQAALTQNRHGAFKIIGGFIASIFLSIFVEVVAMLIVDYLKAA